MKRMYISKGLISIFLIVCIVKKSFCQVKQCSMLNFDNSSAYISNHKILRDTSLIRFSMDSELLEPCKSQKNAFIKAKIDSIRNTLIKDSVNSELIYIDIDFLGENAYGCIIAKNEGKINGKRIELVDNKENTFTIHLKSINATSKKLNELFSFPSQFVEGFFPNTIHKLSHDNEMYFFLKVNGKIMFDKFFMRSSFISTSNEKAKNIIILLGGLYR